MLFYMSGYVAVGRGPILDWMIRECDTRLQSCHEVHIKGAEYWINRSVELGISKGVDLMLDSGAFTAWNKGNKLTLDGLLPIYKRLQDKYQKHFKSVVYINLDTIPGSREKPPTEQEVEQALIESDKNYEILERELGKHILPVYHQGEPLERLKVVAGQSDFICLSARQGIPERLRIGFLQEAAGYLHDQGLGNDLHGLATTGNQIIRSVGWYSVDSSTWALAGVFGSIFIEKNGDLKALAVSDKSPTRYDREKHISSMSDRDREVVADNLGRYNLTIDMVSENHEYRHAYNLVVMRDWARKVAQENRAAQFDQGLFDYF